MKRLLAHSDENAENGLIMSKQFMTAIKICIVASKVEWGRMGRRYLNSVSLI